MSNIGYLIRYRPFIWDEDSNGNMIHNHRSNPIDEFFTDECKFKARITQLLNNDYYEDLNGCVYDGVDIDDTYQCELKRIYYR